MNDLRLNDHETKRTDTRAKKRLTSEASSQVGVPVSAFAKLPSSGKGPVMTPEDLTHRVKKDCVPMIEAATEQTMPTFHVVVEPTLSSQGIQAQAVGGREIRVAHPSCVSHSDLMLHECIHLLQQKKVTGGKKVRSTDAGKLENHPTDSEHTRADQAFEDKRPKPDHDKPRTLDAMMPVMPKSAKGMTAYTFAQSLSQQEAEDEANKAVSRIMRGEAVELHPTDVQVLNQDVTVNEDADIAKQTVPETNTAVPEAKQVSSEKPKLGKGKCVVFYVERQQDVDPKNDTETFRRVAKRFVKNRPNRCYGVDESGNVTVNQPSKFKTGKDIIEGLQAIAKQKGKIAEVYIVSHGYPKGIIGYDDNDHGLYTECSNNTCQSDEQGLSTECSNDTCRTVDDIKAVAPDVFTQNVKIVLHACNVSKEENFAGALYTNIAKALKSKDVGVYGHDNYTMAGYNCSWVQHDANTPDGRSQYKTVKVAEDKEIKIKNPEFNMPRKLQLGNHKTCDRTSGYIGVR